MLELVGNPVAVNPDRAMKKAALENQWDIRTFRDPVPLFTMPGAKEVGIGASVAAGVAALVVAGVWLFQRPALEQRKEPKVTEDRKSTRLNSSHVSISYAVFCLKNKI